tara:strand:- start:379 stop:666 length:288 start_codon:yes stop_codon:yes gene_type:complete
MLLKYCTKNEIKSITVLEQFNVMLPVGKYLVQTDTEGMAFNYCEIVQTGYIRDYREILQYDNLVLQDFIPVEQQFTDVEAKELTSNLSLQLKHYL